MSKMVFFAVNIMRFSKQTAISRMSWIEDFNLNYLKQFYSTQTTAFHEMSI